MGRIEIAAPGASETVDLSTERVEIANIAISAGPPSPFLPAGKHTFRDTRPGGQMVVKFVFQDLEQEAMKKKVLIVVKERNG